MNNDELRDRLLELDPYPEDLKDKIREEIIHLRERPLKTWERPLYFLALVAMGLVLIGAAIAIAICLATSTKMPPVYVLMVIPYVFIGGIFALVVLLKDLKRGIERPRITQFIVYGAAGLVLYMLVGSMLTGSRFDAKDVGACVVVAVLVIAVKIEDSELRLREHALRNELAVAKLTELITNRTAAGPKIEPTP